MVIVSSYKCFFLFKGSSLLLTFALTLGPLFRQEWLFVSGWLFSHLRYALFIIIIIIIIIFFTINNHHQSSSIVINHHQSSSIVINRHQSPSITIDLFSSSLSIIFIIIFDLLRITFWLRDFMKHFSTNFDNESRNSSWLDILSNSFCLV